ncbi:MAG: hypothetical protein Q9160_007877 [Pyrenula sp. 1 TL-2023]
MARHQSDHIPPYSTSSAAVTSTVQSRPVITTIEVPYSISTAAADNGNVKAGDLLVELSESYRGRLVQLANQACGLPGKRDIDLRAAPACDMNAFVQGAVGDGAPGGLDIISFRKPTVTAHDVEAAIRKVLGLQRQLYKSRLWIGGISIVFLGLYVEHQVDNMKGPIHIPKGDLGEPTGPTVSDLPDPTSSSSSGSKSCKTTKSGTASNDDFACPCATINDPEPHIGDPAFTSIAQGILSTILYSPAPTPTPPEAHCQHNDDPRGAMSKVPTEWCVCDVSKTYSTVSGTNACPPSITNGPTMTLQDAPKSSPVPSPTASCVTSEPGPGWNIDRDKIASIVSDYCTKRIDEQKAGTGKVGPSWPGRCSWSIDPKNKDPNTIAANFRVNSDCPNPPPLDHTSCVGVLGHIIDTCPKAPNTPNGRWGGIQTSNCITYQWGVTTMAFTGVGVLEATEGMEGRGVLWR